MGIKAFFQKIGRGIKRGFDKFVSGAGSVIGGAGTYLQQKAIPAIASGASSIAGLLNKASPLLDAAGPEAAAAGAEAANVAGQIGAGVGKFAKFIGSDIANKPPVVANAQQILAFGQSPFGMAIRKSQGLTTPITAADAAAYASGVKPTPAPMANPNPLKVAGMAIKPLIGSNPATYTPKPSSGIEAPASASQPSVITAGVGSGAPMLSM
jgi:hypothetical protein